MKVIYEENCCIIEIVDHVEARVIEPLILPAVVIPDDWDI